MNRLRRFFSIYLTVSVMILGLAAVSNAQIRRNDRDISNTLRSLTTKLDDFRYQLSNEFRRNSVSRDDKERFEDDLRNMDDKIRDFEVKFERKRDSAGDVQNILDEAKTVNDQIKRLNFTDRNYNTWKEILSLLDNLAAYYNISGDWDDRNSNYPNSNRYPAGNYPSSNRSASNSYGLTGTYRLDESRSENTGDILENSNIRNDADREDLEDKLESPELLAIEVRGNQISLASSRADQVTFSADGRDRSEKLPDGRTIRVRTTLRGQDLTISSLGGNSDYTITFSSIDNGRSLKVTRRVTTPYLRQTVFAESVYEKTDAVARLDIFRNPDGAAGGTYSGNDPNNYPNSGNYPTTSSNRTGDFVVPNGTMITGILENDITTKVSQNNDRFKLSVQAPNEFRGAIIEGYISDLSRSGKISGRSQITFNFETIRLPNGRVYDFAGYLQSITDIEGRTIKIGEEGEAKGDSQTKETVKRSGIGAGLGAVLGAIIGGGKGAIIGATIGAGAGAGSVIVQGKDDLEIKQGSSITIQASSPSR